MCSGIAHVIDVKGAFLYGEFEGGEKVYIKIPLGFEEFYDRDTVLLLKKTLYGLKQAAMAFYRKLLDATANIGLKRSTADPCLYCVCVCVFLSSSRGGCPLMQYLLQGEFIPPHACDVILPSVTPSACPWGDVS